jgi:hypothetical protein
VVALSDVIIQEGLTFGHAPAGMKNHCRLRRTCSPAADSSGFCHPESMWRACSRRGGPESTRQSQGRWTQHGRRHGVVDADKGAAKSMQTKSIWTEARRSRHERRHSEGATPIL